jgi:hypothetical protein
VCYDFLLNEWPGVAGNSGLQGGAEDYLHEAALADNPPSGTFYDPGRTGHRLASLGVHEHWNNPIDKKYSRNLGAGPGIELVALTASRPAAVVSIGRTGNQVTVSWQASLGGHLETTADLSGTWSNLASPPACVQGRNIVTNDISEPARFYRLSTVD